MALIRDPAEPDVMRRPPRDPRDALVTWGFGRRMLAEGALLSAGVLGAYLWAVWQDGPGPRASTIAFVALVLIHPLQAMNCRSDRLGWWRLPPNGLSWAAVAILWAVQWAAVSWAPLAHLLGTVSLSAGDWGLMTLWSGSGGAPRGPQGRPGPSVPAMKRSADPRAVGQIARCAWASSRPPCWMDCCDGAGRDDQRAHPYGCGVDAAVVRVGLRGLVLKSDPVTFATTHLGWYVVQVNADIAVMGARPCWFQRRYLPGTRASQVIAIARDIDRRAYEALGIAVTGGHTEVTDGSPGRSWPATCRGS